MRKEGFSLSEVKRRWSLKTTVCGRDEGNERKRQDLVSQVSSVRTRTVRAVVVSGSEYV